MTDTTEAWVQRFNPAGVPCGPVNTMDQVFADPQVRHLNLTSHDYADRCYASRDYAEGRAARREKRIPVFEGR